jgi:flavin reductase (DIM6/NTAB) family NADH-FMN oxidoreductase RutF
MAKVKLGARPLVYPMPAFLVGANVAGKPNFMTAAWGGIAASKPPMVTVALQHHRHTLKGIKESGVFSVNIPAENQAVETDYCGIVTGRKADKTKVCGFRIFSGELTQVPLIEQCPVNLECKVTHILTLGSHSLVIGEVVQSHVSEDCLTDGEPDANKIKPIIYVEGPVAEYRGLGPVLGPAFQIGRSLKTEP